MIKDQNVVHYIRVQKRVIMIKLLESQISVFSVGAVTWKKEFRCDKQDRNRTGRKKNVQRKH